MLPFLSSELSSCRPPACRAYQIWHSYGHSYSGGCCLALSGLGCQRMTSRPWPLLGVGCQSCLCCPLHPCHLPDGPDSLPEFLRRSRPGTCFHNRPGALRRRGCPGSLPPACCCRGCPGNLPGLPDSCPGSCCPDSRLPGACCCHGCPGSLPGLPDSCPGFCCPDSRLPGACCCHGCPGSLPGLPDSRPGSCCPDSRLPGACCCRGCPGSLPGLPDSRPGSCYCHGCPGIH